MCQSSLETVVLKSPRLKANIHFATDWMNISVSEQLVITTKFIIYPLALQSVLVMKDSYIKGQMLGIYPKECPWSNSFRYQFRYNRSIKRISKEYWEGSWGSDFYFLHLQLNSYPTNMSNLSCLLFNYSDFSHQRNPQISHSGMKSNHSRSNLHLGLEKITLVYKASLDFSMK